ncbi:hypothetical protein FGL97_18435 [Pseudomonas putida]|nr:hypothetical protein [Pseudomonas putida]NVN68996.1 hypothetical protein [Pseudomonas putida]
MHHVRKVLVLESHHDLLPGHPGCFALSAPVQHEQFSCKWATCLKTAQLCYDSAPSVIRPTR